MMQNLAQIAQLVKGKDPQSIVMQILSTQQINNPQINQLMTLARNGDDRGVYNLANSIFRQQGLNLQEELSSFMSMLK